MLNLLGVKIDDFSKEDVVEKIKGFLSDGKQHFIVTPNPEFLVLAQKDQDFKNILNLSDISIPDGFGLSVAALFLRGKILHRITGNDLVEKLAEISSQKDCSIYFFGGKEKGTARNASLKLQEKYPKMRAAGFSDEIIIDDPKNTEQGIVDDIKNSNAEILFVALGQGKQEKFIHYNLKKMPNIKVAIGVGGAFEFLAGKQKRAPSWLRRIGLEWLYRLIREPKRWRRIFTAVIIFPFLVLKKIFS